MHWGLDVNLLQNKVKRKSAKAARNLDTIKEWSTLYFLYGRVGPKSDLTKKEVEWRRIPCLNELYPIDAVSLSK